MLPHERGKNTDDYIFIIIIIIILVFDLLQDINTTASWI